MSAVFSECRTWRYTLTRWIVQDSHRFETVAFIGLNPSTADETNDDPTVRRCIGYAKRWGFERMVMLNVFAYRSTDPKALYRLERVEAVGPENDVHLCLEVMGADLAVCCWGVHGALYERGEQVYEMLVRTGKLHMLGLTKDGHPKHPLYLRADLEPVEWSAG